MKILVLSDSHGRIDTAKTVLERLEQQVDMVFHLGDYDEDAKCLQSLFPNLPFHYVKGNNDFGGDTPSHKMVVAQGKRFLLTHGHKQRVHYNLNTIAYWGEEQGADAVLFGHTHVALNDASGRIYLFNPGSITLPRDGFIPTFGIMTVENGKIEGAIMEYTDRGEIRRRKTFLNN
ncbi:metallophosphoesterase [Anaerotignum sp.]|uniref:metallophosphoesterase n=1 Tax=Anaerotignum sp. TaxID=2039241 RepID=UPI002714BF81|nr:metallophosphoesterase [Anaerotignum sp.]